MDIKPDFDTAFAGARKTERIVGRRKELKLIHDSIYHPTANCVVILIEGYGGMGKSRLLEEIIWRAGNPAARKMRPMPEQAAKEVNWAQPDKALISTLIDLRDISLHSRNPFLQAICASLQENREIDFSRFEEAYARFLAIADQGADYRMIQQAEKDALQAFLKDYAENAAQRRLVLCLDTVEELAISSSEWLLKQGLLRENDLLSHTQQWLIEHIRNQGLPNTTILLAGREEEGSFFFKRVEDLCQASPGISVDKLQVIKLPVEQFDAEDVAEYFNTMDEEWGEIASQRPEDKLVPVIADAFHRIAADRERVDVLGLYTGGQPVRLALYADILIEGVQIPEPLNDSKEKAYKRLGITSPGEENERLREARFEIEGELIRLLFWGPEPLQARILRILARTQRGLTVEQIHYALEAEPEISVAGWKKQVNFEKRKKVKEAIWRLLQLSMVKAGPKGTISLQDEIYRIYNTHLKQDPDAKMMERQERDELYQCLRDWARCHCEELEEQRQSYQREDEFHLQQAMLLVKPAEAGMFRFPEQDSMTRQNRLLVRSEIRRHRLDELYYAVLLSPEDALGDTYYDFQETLWQANDEDTSVTAQAELWRILQDKLLLEFTDLKKYQDKVVRKEPVYEILVRAIKQESFARWMKLFILRQDYNRAIDLYDKINEKIPTFSESDRKSWNHTFSRGERLCWYGYAITLKSEPNVSQILEKMIHSAQELEQLAHATTTKIVFPERDERGFIGHPAEPRLRRLLARYYNNIGYGYVTLGKYRAAVRFYGKAFVYMRETKFISQQATTRNNLARALAELGRHRSRRVCLDGLELRKKLGYEIPIAYSYNTLALIDNRLVRPELAWQEAATALAYFRRAGDARGMGLSYIQLGEALRRLANLYRHEERVPIGDIEKIYDEARQSLDKALDIFANVIHSPLRELEVYNERAAVGRDLLSVLDRRIVGKMWDQIYLKSERDFDAAVTRARELKLAYMELDTQLNKAWLYYRGGELERAEKQLLRVEQNRDLIPEKCRLAADRKPPAAAIEESSVYYQLSKLHSLRARIAMGNFTVRTAQIGVEMQKAERRERLLRVHDDPVAKGYLKDAADAFVLALGYAELFSPRNTTMTSTYTYETIYNYLKKFNEQELEDFNAYQVETSKLYQIKQIKPENVADLGDFLHECFGLGE